MKVMNLMLVIERLLIFFQKFRFSSLGSSKARDFKDKSEDEDHGSSESHISSLIYVDDGFYTDPYKEE